MHSVPLRLGQRGDWDEALWQRGKKAEFLGVPVLVPSMSDRYIQAIAHGLVADEDSPADWVVDALIALRDRRFDPSVVAGEIRRRRLGVPLAIGSKILRDRLGVEVSDVIFDACRRDLVNPLFRAEMTATMLLGQERSVIQRLAAGVAEWHRSYQQASPTRTWNTAWLLIPTLRRPTTPWIPFSNGTAAISIPSGLQSGWGQLTVFVEGDGIDAADRSFDLTIGMIWIGRVRIRAASLLRSLPFPRLCAKLRYRVPQQSVRSGPTQLTVALLDDQKMPTTKSLPDVRVTAQVADNNG